jgi:hypothetical protein
MNEQGVQEWTEHLRLRGPCVEDQHGGCVVTYPYNLGVAHQEVQNPVAVVFSPRVLSLLMSFKGTMVLNAELLSINSILT